MLTDLDNIKLILDIDGTASDSYIELVAPICEADYLRIRNLDWELDASGVEEYPENLEQVVAEMIGYKLEKRHSIAASSERLADSSTTYEVTSAGYPSSITQAIKKYVTIT